MKGVILFLIMFNLLGNTAAELELEADWHGGKMCISCHDTVLPASSSNRINDKCLCHYPPADPVWHDKVDIQSIKNIHGSRPCIKCHAHSMATFAQEGLHNIHISIECENCHGSNDVIKPAYSDCFSCHKKDVHGIHDLENLCIICHGRFGKETIQQFDSGHVPVTADLSSLPEKKKFPTIIAFLKSIFGWLKI